VRVVWKALRKAARDEANFVLKVEDAGAFLIGPWWKARKALDVMGVCLSAAVTANGRRMRNAIMLCVSWVDCLIGRVVKEAATASSRRRRRFEPHLPSYAPSA
jgi:hypothetical protein